MNNMYPPEEALLAFLGLVVIVIAVIVAVAT